jgi:3-methyl-2-oxobutanoate hydroxymethyltransferase
MPEAESIQDAFRRYGEQVRNGQFPAEEHGFD